MLLFVSTLSPTSFVPNTVSLLIPRQQQDHTCILFSFPRLFLPPSKVSTNISKSQAIATPQTIYCSGQIPCTPSGEILTQPSSTITQMTELCINNLSAVLKEAGSSLQKVVKVNVFLTSMDNFAEMNATYERFFTHKPARSCLAVYQLPKGVPVEIECIALA